LSVQVSRRINDWCWWHWSNGFAVVLLASSVLATVFLASTVAATLAAIFLASTVAATLAVTVTLLACIALATLAAIAALVASKDTI
jgi:hypothetical protein